MNSKDDNNKSLLDDSSQLEELDKSPSQEQQQNLEQVQENLANTEISLIDNLTATKTSITLLADDSSTDKVSLASYAQRAYLEYALSVVKGRALPDVCDGQKPVQRRILYAMARLGLSFVGKNGAKPVKSSRVVGDVLGRFHPHGDQAAYDALVRMAQDFSQRYPLIDGQGNFGSRDGDSAAAMRYTEARLSPLAQLLLDEVDIGTVDFINNYDGSTTEPSLLPARLPMVLLNGASGIAVGLSTEIPSHNLDEVARASVALMRNADISDEELFSLIPGPDYPGGAQIINSPKEISNIYLTGRGSLKIRARWTIEELAKGYWQLVINELPPNVSTQKVLEEIEEISNPKLKLGKKTLTNEQIQLKNNVLAVLDSVRDESNQQAPVRIVIEPKSSRIKQDNLLAILLVHTSLETSASINLTSIGIDGNPMQKSLRQMLLEWNEFRIRTVLRRCQFELAKIQDRIHVLEGRQLVLLNIDQVISIIRNSDEPKLALIKTFNLSQRQAEDILEIRLRQLARLEAIKIEQELTQLRQQQLRLQEMVDKPTVLKRQVIKEIEIDRKQFADSRRTIIEQQDKASFKLQVQNEAVTVVISQKGWVRVRLGHSIDKSALKFKFGDELLTSFECRSVDYLLAFERSGRVFSLPITSLPDGRGDGQPIATLIDLAPDNKLLYYFAGNLEQQLLLANSAGYGFIAKVKDMLTKQKTGKDFISLNKGENLVQPSVLRYAPMQLNEGTQLEQQLPTSQLLTNRIACLSFNGRLLTFSAESVKSLKNGGRGLMLMGLEPNDYMLGAVAYERSIRIDGIGRGNKPRSESLETRSLNNAYSARGRKGKQVNFTFKLQKIVAVQ